MKTPLLITDFLHRANDLFSGKQIVQYQHGGELHRYDYREYHERVVRLAGALVDMGVRSGDRVATLAWNHSRHLELYLAVPLAGAVLHTVNLRLTPEEIGYIVEHAEDRVLFADSSLLDQLSIARGLRPEMPIVAIDEHDGADGGLVLNYEDLLSGPPLDEQPPLDEDDLAALCYTSGTTGRPKGVGYSHRALYLHTFAACLADGHAISEQDTVLHVVPMFHANAWGIPLAATMSGANQVLPGPHPTPEEIARIIEAERITYVGMVPTVAVDVLKHVEDCGTDLSSLRALVLGGSSPSTELVRSLEDGLGVPVYQGWGMTEISPMGTFSRPPATEHDPSARHAYIRTQGRLLPGLQWQLVDDEGERVAHDGRAKGELLLRGPWVASSYYRGEHPEAFVDGWFRTGDVATISPDGYLEIIDRTKDLIKSGGEWISSVALEEVLLQHPAVLRAAVVAVPHERWQERPLAVVVLDEQQRSNPDELTAHLRERIPRWWLPERILITEELPQTGVGKIDKRALRASVSADP